MCVCACVRVREREKERVCSIMCAKERDLASERVRNRNKVREKINSRVRVIVRQK